MSTPKKRPPARDRTPEHLARLNEARDFVALADALFMATLAGTIRSRLVRTDPDEQAAS